MITLADIAQEFRKGKIREAELRHYSVHLDGLCDFGTGAVYVDPRPQVVLTLVHELMHRRYPQWSERRVDRESTLLVSKMSTRQMNAWYRRYQAVATKHKQPKRVSDE